MLLLHLIFCVVNLNAFERYFSILHKQHIIIYPYLSKKTSSYNFKMVWAILFKL